MAFVPDANSEPLSRALGIAVVRAWSRLPNDAQQLLFEEAVASQGERIRPQLAIYLHANHPRTLDSLRERALSEPDSLGG